MARGRLILHPEADEAATDHLAEQFAGLGIQWEDDLVVDEEEFWLWPENEEVFWLWAGLQTQWVIGMAGAVGLNYPSVETDLRMLAPKKKHRDYYLLIKNMEQAALEEWASKR